MGLVHASIELVNGDDLSLVRRHIIDEDEVKRMRVEVLVDTGSYYMCINENIQEYLQLPVVGMRRGQLANGQIVECDVVGPLHILFENRSCIQTAMVLPGDSEPLLGAIPMEDMDVIIHPLRQELVVHPDHPDMAMCRV